MTQRILITGATGFLSQAIHEAAATRAWPAAGVSRQELACEQWQAANRFRDDGDVQSYQRAIENFRPTIIFHGAGTASVSESFRRPHEDLQASLLSFARCLEAVRLTGSKATVLFPSSAAVYGDPATLPVGEDSVLAPSSPYGHHKRMAEALAQEYVENFGVDVVTCRIFSTVGFHQRQLLVWEVFDAAQKVGEVILQGTGGETRDYLEVSDLARVLLEVALHVDRPTVLNLGTGNEISSLDVARVIREKLGIKADVRCRGEEQLGKPKNWRADITRLQALGIQAKQSALEGISDVLDAWIEDARCG